MQNQPRRCGLDARLVRNVQPGETPLSIRPATMDDLGSIVAIYNASIPARMATADTQPVSVESRTTWFKQHTPERHPLWVAEADGSVAAWLGLAAFYGRPAYVRTAEVSLYVHPGQQRRGLGSALLGHALAQSPRLGIETLLAFIFAHNSPSLVLWRSVG
jgi:L-amino acid N-acyltransferase YncA